VQTRQLGTGHAVLAAKSAVGRVDDVLVANGDFDPVLPEDIRALLRRHRRVDAVATIASTELRDPGTYQRIVRDGGRVIDVVEGTDAPTEVRRINEVGTNWMAFRRGPLFAALPKVRRNNRQHEYYLNDAVSILLRSGARVEALLCDTGGTLGLNSRGGLAVILGSTIGKDVAVGPFVRMRPGVEMADGSKAGAFVDLKAARVGRGSKVPHLSYVGDADLGEDVNVGAGTVTINYDGYAKHRTVIEDGARIGSDTMLVAPVRVGRDAVTGAGSVITKDVPPGSLAVERTEQRNVPGYRERKDAEHRRGTRRR